ncbi:hypothetical protein IPH67_03800 [bacterium]|nr:MAG: hypothetical protein IPH67_03800 [bacterium]
MQFIFQRCCFTVLFLLFCGVSDAYPLHTKDTDEVLNDHADALIDFCSKHIDEYLLNGVHIEPEGVAELLNRQNINFLDVFLHCLDADLVQSVGANSDVAKRIICERVQQRYHKNAAYQENFPSYREQFDRNLKQYKNGFADGSKLKPILHSFPNAHII